MIECSKCDREFETGRGASIHWGQVHDGPHPFNMNARAIPRAEFVERTKHLLE